MHVRPGPHSPMLNGLPDAPPLTLCRLTLARVTTAAQASFGAIYLRDPEDDALLRLACAHNWPQASARYLGGLRIRVGRGPTGRCVALARPLEVENVYADESLSEWWEAASELGFTSVAAHPLSVNRRVVGSLSLYFAERRRFGPAIAEALSGAAVELGRGPRTGR